MEYPKADLSASGSPVPRVTVSKPASFAAGNPVGLAVDPSGDLWVQGSPSANADAVCEYPKAQLAKTVAPKPHVTIAPGYQLWDFTFDSSGNLWVPDYNADSLGTPKATLPSRALQRLRSPFPSLLRQITSTPRPTLPSTPRATYGSSTMATKRWSSTPRHSSPSPAHRCQQRPFRAQPRDWTTRSTWRSSRRPGTISTK